MTTAKGVRNGALRYRVAMFATIVLAAALTGSYPTGFDVITARDMSRPDITSSAKGRPVQISIWYPSAGAASNPMKFREYANLLGTYEGVPRSSATDKLGIERFLETTRSRSQSSSSIDEHLAKILNTTVRAYREAPPARGKFPLVLFPEHRAPATNSLMAETLASHGYVVASVPVMGTFELEFDSGLSGLETLVADMRVAVHEISRLKFVDLSRIAVMGTGVSANAGVAYATRNRDIDALVSLEGDLANPLQNSILHRTPYFDPSSLRAPMLLIEAPFEGRDDSLLAQYDHSDRWHIEFPAMKEPYFLNYGALEADYPNVVGPSPGEVTTAYEWSVRYVIAFLDTTLGGKSDAFLKAGEPEERVAKIRLEKAKPPQKP